MLSLEDQAIQAALKGRWDEAVRLNQQLLSITSADTTEVLNRLAYAQAKCGGFQDACITYQMVLQKDPYNPIALKNLAKYKAYKNASASPASRVSKDNGTRCLSPDMFLVDAQKAKSVNLINLAPRVIIQNISIGEQVFPYRRRYELQIKNNNGVYLGTLPDDIGRSLIQLLMNQGNNCAFFVKDVGERLLTIFVKY
ncbi:hypothetical protein HY468_03455 [Candidatus Roizmanbacteria bacterium]|nr:hypothetical protein [Candidatus Roizmanbacteria bacterium]